MAQNESVVKIDLVFSCESIESLRKAVDVAIELVEEYPDEPRFEVLCGLISDAIEQSTVEEES